MNFKKKIFIVFFAVITIGVYSQRSSDIGFFLGGSSYMGDINPSRLLYKPGLALGIDYRKNYNPVFSMKYTAKRGRLRAYDRDFPNAYQQLRGFSFSKHTIYEVAALMEYNFYPIGMEKSGKYKFTPYINLGGAIMYCNRISRKFQFVIPFGVGVKYRFTPKIELGIEWVFRRTFTDKLDGLPIYYEMADAIYGNKQRGFASNRDWYSFLGVTLHYCLRKTGFKCPAYNDIR